jgi:hypothetical protein
VTCSTAQARQQPWCRSDSETKPEHTDPSTQVDVVNGRKVREIDVGRGKPASRSRTAYLPWLVGKRYEDRSDSSVSQTPRGRKVDAPHDGAQRAHRTCRGHTPPGVTLSPGRTGRSTRWKQCTRSRGRSADWNISAVVGSREGSTRNRTKRGHDARTGWSTIRQIDDPERRTKTWISFTPGLFRKG